MQPLPPLDAKGMAVERAELGSVPTGRDTAALPQETWQGLDGRSVEALVAQLDIPPRSPTLGALWRRLWVSPAAPPGGAVGGVHYEALRLEALYRSGLIADAARIAAVSTARDPLLSAIRARLAIGAGERDMGCAEARAVAKSKGNIPKPVKTEMLLLSGYCAAAEGNREAAELTADLARGEESGAPLAVAALDSIATGQPFKPQLPNRVSLMDYRFLELAKSADPISAAERAEPALLVALGEGSATEPRLRVAAAELAARGNSLDPQRLAAIYREQTFQPATLADPLNAKVDQVLRRALLFKAAEAERTPMRKTRIVRALLDEARRLDLAVPIAALLVEAIGDTAPAQEIGWFAETGVEINLAAGRYDAARSWVNFAARDGGDSLGHWLLLIDIADPKWQGPRGAGFAHVEALASRGRLPSELLHRLATVLDALDYQIPIPLWEAASRTPQPASGHLPETGVLSQLQEAAKKKEFGRTVLLAMRTLGPSSADGAHIIALGDAIRALRRAGLDADARRLGFEAVYLSWPRTGS